MLSSDGAIQRRLVAIRSDPPSTFPVLGKQGSRTVLEWMDGYTKCSNVCDIRG